MGVKWVYTLNESWVGVNGSQILRQILTGSLNNPSRFKSFVTNLGGRNPRVISLRNIFRNTVLFATFEIEARECDFSFVPTTKREDK